MWAATLTLWVSLLFGAEAPKGAAAEVPPNVRQFLKAVEASRQDEIRRLQARVKELETPSKDKTKRRSRRQELREANREIKRLESSAGKPILSRSQDGRIQHLPTLQPHNFQGNHIGTLSDKNINFIAYQILSEREVLVQAKYTVAPPSNKRPQKKLGNDPVISDVFVIRGLRTKGMKESAPLDLSGKVFQVKHVKDFATGVPGARVTSLVDVFDMQPVLDWLGKRKTVPKRTQNARGEAPKNKAKPTASAPKKAQPTAQPKPPPSKEAIEKRAAGKLKLALKFLKKKPKVAKRRLKEIREDYPDTQAAKQALEHLQKLDK